MATNDESSIEARVARLERVVVLQAQLASKLGTAVGGHQIVIEALARLAGVELEIQPASAPLNN